LDFEPIQMSKDSAAVHAKSFHDLADCYTTLMEVL